MIIAILEIHYSLRGAESTLHSELSSSTAMANCRDNMSRTSRRSAAMAGVYIPHMSVCETHEQWLEIFRNEATDSVSASSPTPYLVHRYIFVGSANDQQTNASITHMLVFNLLCRFPRLPRAPIPLALPVPLHILIQRTQFPPLNCPLPSFLISLNAQQMPSCSSTLLLPLSLFVLPIPSPTTPSNPSPQSLNTSPTPPRPNPIIPLRNLHALLKRRRFLRSLRPRQHRPPPQRDED